MGTPDARSAPTEGAGETPYERAVRDARFLRRFTEAYRGEHDPLDALWWLEHPFRSTPSGTASPYAESERLRLAVYARTAGPAAAGRYRRLLRRVDDDATVAAAAVAEAERRTAGALRVGPAVAPATASRRRWRMRPVAVVAVLTVVAFAVGIAAGAAPKRPDAAATAPSAAVAAAPALAVFDRPQLDRDTVAVEPGTTLVASSFRRLGGPSPSGVVAYAARDRQGRVCLAAVPPGTQPTAVCGSLSGFGRFPLTLDVSTGPGGAELSAPEAVATWDGSGDFTLSEDPPASW